MEEIVDTGYLYFSPRAQALSALAQRLVLAAPANLHELWQTTVHRVVQNQRDKVLFDLAALAPVLLKLGGDQASIASACKLRQIVCWWP